LKRFIHISLLLLLPGCLLCLSSCENEDQRRIPEASVYMELNLAASYPTFRNSVNDTLVFTRPRNGHPTDRVGYGGILVYTFVNGTDLNYCAFDLCCPNEVNPNIRVNPNDRGEAVCKSCGTVYQLLTGTGMVISGPSKWNLKRYKVQLSGDMLYISR
jgi:nitrite reductase/ring-hydroxylating ferredoxin subunit